MVKKIAIACQGGGSHTAFTAGVLKRILKEETKDFEIVGLSGTSGGAICALLAWYGLLKNDKKLSIEKLDGFWRDNSASSLWDSILNEWILWSVRMQGLITTPEISPYYLPTWAQDQLRGLLEKYVDFDDIKTLVNSSSPRLFIGATDVLSGKFKVFKNDENCADTILASAAIPTFFRSVKIDKTIYWDGLFSQNPPLRDFLVDSREKPDELWVIQINPETRKKEPVSVKEITDRRNELAGNLSLYQEVYFIETVNKWVIAGEFVDKDKFKNIKIQWIKMENEMEYESKLNRNPTFIQDLMTYGEKQAEDFLK
jgi:NTE family protein